MLSSITQTGSNRRLLWAALGLLTALAGAFYALYYGVDYRNVLMVAGLLVGAVIVGGGERGIYLGFVLWALSMAVGYRTISWSSSLRIHPSEILLCLLFVGMFAHRRLLSESRVSLPLWVWLSIPFWILGWWPLVSENANLSAMFSEFRSFVMLIPLLFVAQVVLNDKRNWRYVVTAFFIASTWIALMGALEYWVPAVTTVFPAFISNAKAAPTADGFVRAQFSFWGNQSATFLCVLSFPLCVILFRWWRSLGIKIAIVIATILQLVAIYIGGFRSLWLLVVLQVAAGCFFGLRKRGLGVAVLCIVVAAVGYQFIPKTDARVITTIAVLKGTPVDHSSQVRLGRATAAIERTLENPFGNGWHSAGWVHSDFLQVAANLGIIAALIFVAGYLYTFGRLALAVRRASGYPRSDRIELAFSLLLSFIAAGGLLASQGVQVLPQLILPVWFIWVLIEVWLRQAPEADEFSYSYVPTNFYPAANLQ